MTRTERPIERRHAHGAPLVAASDDGTVDVRVLLLVWGSQADGSVISNKAANQTVKRSPVVRDADGHQIETSAASLEVDKRGLWLRFRAQADMIPAGATIDVDVEAIREEVVEDVRTIREVKVTAAVVQPPPPRVRPITLAFAASVADKFRRAGAGR